MLRELHVIESNVLHSQPRTEATFGKVMHYSVVQDHSRLLKLVWTARFLTTVSSEVSVTEDEIVGLKTALPAGHPVVNRTVAGL